MATSPNYGWPEPDNTDLVKNGALAMRTLGNAIDTTMATMVPKSLVDAKGDIVTATADNTPARLAVGNNGEQLLADSTATSGLRWAATPSASNPVLNSAFNVWQRGTSFTIASSAFTYIADRWQIYRAATGCTVTRQATGDTTNLPNIQYAMRIARDSGNTSTSIIYAAQSMESINSIPFAGKQVTFSFYARAGANYSASGNTLNAYLYSGTGTDQNVLSSGYTGQTAVVSLPATLTTTWQRFTGTGTVAATATELGIYYTITPVGTAGANDYVEITGVQIDVGNVALPYRAYGATYQGELAACQRYYNVIGGVNNGFPTPTGYASASGQTLRFPMFLPVQMRTAPTITKNGTWAAGNADQTTLGGTYISTSGFSLSYNSNAAGQCYVIPDSTDDTLTISAEL